MQSKTTRHAFSLVELLVVVAVIGVLAALLFPVFAQAKTSSRLADARERMRGIHRAVVLYASDWGTMPFAKDIAWMDGSGLGSERAERLWKFALPYPLAYEPLGVPRSAWFMDAPYDDMGREAAFESWDGMALVSEPYSMWEARVRCPLFEEVPKWRGKGTHDPRLVLLPDGSVTMRPRSFGGLNDAECFLDPMRRYEED